MNTEKMHTSPTVFHITHRKAGSQWIAEILKQCDPSRFVEPEEFVAHFYDVPIQAGAIYPAVYAAKHDFDTVMNLVPFPHKKFVVIRDLRDTLISEYFSLKYSHPLIHEKYRKWREILIGCDKTQGLLYIMDEILPIYADFQRSWIDDDTWLIKYEDLIRDEFVIFEKIIEYCQINISQTKLSDIVCNNSFEIVSGRRRGQEDLNVHQRKGIAGDWQNHFSAQMTEEFKKRFGNILIKTGYETNLNWQPGVKLLSQSSPLQIISNSKPFAPKADSEHDSLISYLSDIAEYRFQIICRQKDKLLDKEKVIQTQQHELVTKDKLFHTQQNDLLTKDNQIKIQQDELIAKEQVIQAQQREQAAKDALIQEQNQRLLERNEAVQTLHEQLEEKERVIQVQQREQTAKDALIQAQNQRLLERDDAAQTLREQLEEKERVIQAQQREQAAKDTLIQAQHHHLDDQEMLTQTLREQLEEKERVIQAQQREQALKDELLDRMRAELEAQTAASTADRAQLSSLQTELNDQIQTAAQQQQELIAKEACIQTQHQDLIAKEAVIQQFIAARQSLFRFCDIYYVRPCLKRRLPISLQTHLRQWRRHVQPKLGVFYQYSPHPVCIPAFYHGTPLVREASSPLVSIVTPSFNHARFLERTIQSVLTQHYPAVEYIMQDGASTDDTLRILESYRDRLTHLASCQDDGQANAINRGFCHATGEIMAWLNSDDVLLPGTVAYVVNFFLKHPEIDVVYGHRIIIDEQDQEIGRWVLPPHDDTMLLWADYIPQETLFWRRQIWEKAGGYVDESYHFALDWELLLRFYDAGAKFARLPRFLAGFRVHGAQKTSRELEGRGWQEMSKLRKQRHGRDISNEEALHHLRNYLRNHLIYHAFYRAGLLKY